MNSENEERQQPEPVQPPPGDYQPTPGPAPAAPPQDTNTLIILGWVFVVLGLFCCCCPPLFAIPGIVLGIIAYSKGDQRGLWVIIAGAIVLVAGGALSFTFKPHRWVPYFEREWPSVPWRRV